MKAVLSSIDDQALYPGSYVKELIRKMGGQDGEALRWIEVPVAAIVLDRRPDTLRRQCTGWSRMETPPVRVCKKGPAEGSHWLLCEQDVYGLARTRRPLTFGPEEPATSNGLPQAHTLKELLDTYHKAHPDWSDGHRKQQQVNRRFWLRHLGPDLQLTAATPAAAQGAIRAEMNDPGKADAFGSRSQQKRLRYLKDAFGYATDQLMWLKPDQNALRGLKMPKVRGRSRPYSREETLRLVPATEKVDLRLAVLTHIAWVTGRRLAAILSLPVSAYEREGEFGRITFPGETDKARRSGEVYITGRAKELVEELLTSRAARSSEMLFPTGDLSKECPTGETISDQAMRDWLRKAEEIAEVETVKGRAFHGLKRRYATEAMRHDPQAASKQSGTNKGTLEGAYVQDDAEPKRELAAYMDSLLRAEA